MVLVGILMDTVTSEKKNKIKLFQTVVVTDEITLDKLFISEICHEIARMQIDWLNFLFLSSLECLM